MILPFYRRICIGSLENYLFQTISIVWFMLFSNGQLSGQYAPRDTSFFVNSDGARLFVRSVGSGTPMVIIHGGPGMSQDYLAPQLIDLLAKEYTLIFYDQRASGRSSGVEDTTRLTMSQFVMDLENLRKSLKLDRMNLLGHSFGGLLSMYYAVNHPEAVGKILLLDTSPASWELNFPYFLRTISQRQTEANLREMASLKEAAATDPATMDRYLKVFFRTFFYNPHFSDSLQLGINDQWLVNNKVTGERIWKDLGHYDIHDRLAGITAPVLIVHGDASVISVDGAKAIADRIPQSKFMLLEKVGHFPYIEAPLEFAVALKDFIR